MIFKCKNDCEDSQRSESRISASFKEINGEMRFVNCTTSGELLICQTCGEPLDNVTPFEGVGSFRRIHSLPFEEKKKYLKNRANAHSSFLRKKGRAR